MSDFTASELRARIQKQVETNVEKFDREIGLDQESAESWQKRWEAEQQDNGCYDLRDDGRSDGYGESYAERNQ